MNDVLIFLPFLRYALIIKERGGITVNRYYLAVDIGASSGRQILGWMEDGRMRLQEIYRFTNGMEPVDGTLCWDTKRLFGEIKKGMGVCAELGIRPVSMGIDTWAVDYVLLDKDGEPLGKTAGDRDRRTEGMDRKVYDIISQEELYRRTGIQKQIFNTIYQLMSVKQSQPELLEQADSFLMIPDYFNYLLTGVKRQEYTNATTTQLVSPESNDWDRELIGRLGYPDHLFSRLSMPGTVVGPLTEAVKQETGLDCQVVLPPTHDTASAVAAVPSDREEVLYISSGTWSLMGTELMKADVGTESCRANFTNEGGYGHRFRFLKNIMGLWMIQSVKKEWKAEGHDHSFEEICKEASRQSIPSIVDCNDSRFLAPESMCAEVEQYCRESGQPVPGTRWELAAVIYNSLADCYRTCCDEIERLTGRHYGCIHIVGGGSNADYLNRLTAKAAGRTVYAGPAEATAIGSLLVQMMRDGVYKDLMEARRNIFASFDIRTYEPEES